MLPRPWLAVWLTDHHSHPPGVQVASAPSRRLTKVLAAAADTASLTQRIFDQVDSQWSTQQSGGAGGRTTFEALQGVDRAWSNIRSNKVNCVTYQRLVGVKFRVRSRHLPTLSGALLAGIAARVRSGTHRWQPLRRPVANSTKSKLES